MALAGFCLPVSFLALEGYGEWLQMQMSFLILLEGLKI